MRAYSAVEEEALRTRDLLTEWAGDELITAAQRERMEQDTPCELRRTNVFLRIVLFVFTVLLTTAAVGLFFSVVMSRPSNVTVGIFLVLFAGACYAGAEIVVWEKRFYRHGVEEGLATVSVGLLCAGIVAIFSKGGFGPAAPVAGSLVSIWLWHRFGFRYALAAAMIFAVWIGPNWTSSQAAQRAIVECFYAGGLVVLIGRRSRCAGTYLEAEYSIAEGMLWLGIYLAANLRIFDAWSGANRGGAQFGQAFYWATWVLIWCLPVVVLARGLRRKDRFVMAAGGVAAVLTLVTNKPYLGWQRNSWDPMLLGALLVGVVLWVRRWLAAGEGGVRNGFTAERLSGKDLRRMNLAAAALGAMAPHSITLQPDARHPDVRFGGGDSGGGGASSDY